MLDVVAQNKTKNPNKNINLVYMPEQEKYLTLNRGFFSETMPDDMKRVFMLVVNNTPCFPDDQKAFLCGCIHNYEKIDDYTRGQLLDVLDDLHLFVDNR